MLALEKHIKLWQLIAAILAVPAGVAGTYSVYRTYVAGAVSCHDLRASIIATLDRNLTADVKRTLLRGDVEKFDKNCGTDDPDALVIFRNAVAMPQTQGNASATPAAGRAPVFGLSRSGERRGWVVLMRRKGAGDTEPNFDGFTVTGNSAPPVGTVLKARNLMPVWLEPPAAAQTSDPSALQGRIAAGTCVKLVAPGPVNRRLWAEVTPEPCP